MTAWQGVPERLPGVKVHGHTLGHGGVLPCEAKAALICVYGYDRFEDVWCSWRLLALARRRSLARSGFTAPGPRVGGPELRSPRVDVWDEAVQFLLIGDRARQLAEQHPWTADGCSSCARPECVAARMAVEALELLDQGERLRM